jgi:hypothetical protein
VEGEGGGGDTYMEEYIHKKYTFFLHFNRYLKVNGKAAYVVSVTKINIQCKIFGELSNFLDNFVHCFPLQNNRTEEYSYNM